MEVFRVTFLRKSKKKAAIVHLIKDAFSILDSLGIPMSVQTDRKAERMCMAFLAALKITNSDEWTKAKIVDEGWAPTTKQILKFYNDNFEENLSMGSYDDVKRKDLKLLILDGIILESANNLKAAKNNPTRGYALNPEYSDIVGSYGKYDWQKQVKTFLKDKVSLSNILKKPRMIPMQKVDLPNGIGIKLSIGEHNLLQKKIVEEFLPRFGFQSEILYLGDSANRMLLFEEKKLKALSFFDLKQSKLPDVIAYSKSKNWLFLIEAVHISGPTSPTRRVEMERLTKNCSADIVYITAFLDGITFKKFVSTISWETEVWIAEEPNHLVHFNGSKFLGPYTH